MDRHRDDPNRGRELIRWQWDGFLPRSYLFSIEPIDRKPANLHQIELPAGHLFLSPDYACCVQSVGPSFVALIGHCIDLDRPDAPESDVASSLLQRAIRHGIDAMLAATDYLAGRFAAICHVGDGWHVFADACATRTVYFAEDRSAIGPIRLFWVI